MKKLIIKMVCGVVVTASMMMMAACGGSHKASSPEAEQQRNALYEAMAAGNTDKVELLADSLSRFTDDLTVDESVAVLLAYLQVHNKASKAGDETKDLVTLRKFVDLYDIVTLNGGDDIDKAFNKAVELNGNLNLPELATTFKKQLAEFDAGTANDTGEPGEKVSEKKDKKDSDKKDSDKKDSDKKDSEKEKKQSEDKKAEDKKAEAPKAETPKAESTSVPETMPLD